MSRDEAPSAARMPISRVRSATEYEMTPYTPTAVMSSATIPNASSMIMTKRRGPTDCATSSVSGATW